MRQPVPDRLRAPAARPRWSKCSLVVVLAMSSVLQSGCYGGRSIPVSRPAASDLPFVAHVRFSPPGRVILYALRDSTETGVSVIDSVTAISGHLVATLGDSLVIQTTVIRDRRGFDYTRGIITVVPDSTRGVRVTRFLPRMTYRQRQNTEKAIRFAALLTYGSLLWYGLLQPW